jgi:head-tail adaptor
MTLKAKYQLGIKRYQEGATDAHGNPVESWGSVENVAVYAVAPSFSNEPAGSGRDAVITGLSVLAPLGTDIDAKDRAVWNSEEYTIEGDLADWTNGPFDFEPGIQFNLKKVDG